MKKLFILCLLSILLFACDPNVTPGPIGPEGPQGEPGPGAVKMTFTITSSGAVSGYDTTDGNIYNILLSDERIIKNATYDFWLISSSGNKFPLSQVEVGITSFHLIHLPIISDGSIFFQTTQNFLGDTIEVWKIPNSQ